MNNRRKIGFQAYYDNTQNYSPIGTTSKKCYKTSAELVYDISNIIAVRPAELAKQLSDAGYHVEYLAGQPYWVLYEKS